MAMELSAESTITKKEMDVAEILRDLSSTIESRPFVFTEDFNWGVRRRRPQPIYEIVSKSEQADPEGVKKSIRIVQKEKKNGRDAQLGNQPQKQVTKKKAKKEIIKEKKKDVTSLTKENEDLRKELMEQKEKYEELRAMNYNLKDQTLDELKAARRWQIIRKSVLVMKFKLKRLPLPPLETGTDQSCRQEDDPRAQMSEDMAIRTAKDPLMCQFGRVEKSAKSAKSAHGRKRRLEVIREKKVHKRQAVNRSSD